MNEGFIDLLQRMKTDREKHVSWLENWKGSGGKLDYSPDGETIDDMISREKRAVENLRTTIERISKA